MAVTLKRAQKARPPRAREEVVEPLVTPSAPSASSAPAAFSAPSAPISPWSTQNLNEHEVQSEGHLDPQWEFNLRSLRLRIPIPAFFIRRR